MDDANGFVRRVASAPIGDFKFREAMMECYLGIRPHSGHRLTGDIQETAWFCKVVSRLILQWHLDCQSKKIEISDGDASLPRELSFVFCIGGRYILKSSNSVAEINAPMAFLFCCAQDTSAPHVQVYVERFFSGSQDEILEEIKARKAQLYEVDKLSKLDLPSE